MIEHVFRRARESGANEIVIATDDERIREAASRFTDNICMTATTHASGTDRIAESELADDTFAAEAAESEAAQAALNAFPSSMRTW